MSDNIAKDAPSIWAVIPTWNRREDVLRCVESIYKADYPSIKVNVIDNGSTDGTMAAVEKAYPEVIIDRLDRNLGASVASNIGINHALQNQADYILRIDSDICIDKSMLVELIKAAESQSDIGMVFPLIFRYDQPDTVWYTGAKKHPFLIISKVENYNANKIQIGDSLSETDFVPSAVILIKVDVFKEINGFDEDFFVYSEDFDLCIRLRESGRKIIFCPFAKAWHKIGSEQLSEFGMFQFYKSKMLFYRKHSSGLHTLLLVLYTFIYIVYRTVFKSPKESLRFALKGFVSGLKYPLKRH